MLKQDQLKTQTFITGLKHEINERGEVVIALDENGNSTRVSRGLTFGVEIEQVGITRYNNGCLNEINQMFTGRERFKQVTDGSISGNGSEFVSGIMEWTSIKNVQAAVRLIRERGGRPHSSCGVHVHIDGSRFLQDPAALIRLIKIVDKYERLMYHSLNADNRMTGRWSRPVCQDFLNRVCALKKPSIDDIRREWYLRNGGSQHYRYDHSRYRLLNLHALFSKGTIEFRCFNSTLHAGRVKTYIQLCGHIVAQALLTKRASKGQRAFNQDRAKYEVRTWLIRLGLIGKTYTTARKLLTEHLQGDSTYHRA